MPSECFSCFRRAKYRVAGQQDVGDKVELACHFHLQLAVTGLLRDHTTVRVTYA